MSRLDDLALARIHLSKAVNRSKDGVVMDAEQRAEAAVDHLRYAGCDKIATRVNDAITGGVASSEARRELREAMQFIDVEIVDTVDSIPIEEAFESGVAP